MDFIGDLIIGYTKDKDDRFLLWVNKGKIEEAYSSACYPMHRARVAKKSSLPNE